MCVKTMITLGLDSWAVGRTLDEIVHMAEQLIKGPLKVEVRWPMSARVKRFEITPKQANGGTSLDPSDENTDALRCYAGTTFIVTGSSETVTNFDVLVNLGPEVL